MALSESEQTELARLLEEEARWQSRNKLFSYYPDKGPLRRELYPKHLQHFAAGKFFNERAIIGGNRCLTMETPVETDRGERRIAEIAGEIGFGVVAWVDGSRQSVRAGPVFPKGIEPAFQIRLDNGEVFQCSRRHRVLTTEGWLSLAQLILRADGQRCWNEVADCSASYGAGGHQDGAEPHLAEDTGRARPPSIGDARRFGQLFGTQDEVGHRPSRSHAYRGLGHPSIPDALREPEGQFEPFQFYPFGEVARLHDPRLNHLRQVSQQSHPRLDLQQQDARSLNYLECNPGPYGEARLARGAGDRQRPMALTGPVSPRSASALDLGCEVLEWLHDEQGTSTFYPSSHPILIGGNRILSVTGIGCQRIVDFTVPGPHNYMACGVVHHNSGKSLACTYEHVLHLIGYYPHWWEGFRFDQPIVGWAAGEDNKSIRESLQVILLGPTGAHGTGLIPADNIKNITPRAGVPDAVDTIVVKSSFGGLSRLTLKAYEQGRESYQAARVQVVQLDEEPPIDIYTESLTRTMSTVPGEPNGLLICGFTPLRGLSQVVMQYMPGGERQEGAVTGAS